MLEDSSRQPGVEEQAEQVQRIFVIEIFVLLSVLTSTRQLIAIRPPFREQSPSHTMGQAQTPLMLVPRKSCPECGNLYLPLFEVVGIDSISLE